MDVVDEHRLCRTTHVNPPLVHLCHKDCDDHDLFGDSDYEEEEYGVYFLMSPEIDFLHLETLDEEEEEEETTLINID